MGLAKVEEDVKKPKISKKLAKRLLWIESVKVALTVLVFLVGLALLTNFINGYLTVYIFRDRPRFIPFVLILGIVAYIMVFFTVYKKLGFKFIDRIDELKTMVDNLD